MLFGARIAALRANAMLLLSWRSLPRAVRPSLGWWLAGMLLHPVGFMLITLRDLAPDWLSVLAANTAIAAGLACMVISLRNLYGLPERRRELFGLRVLVALLARAGHEAFWPAFETDLIKASPVNLICLGMILLLPVLTTVGFLLMCTRRSHEEFGRTARLDHLTGIYNRRAIEDLAGRALSAARRHGIPLAILILDLDHFKHINDQHGRQGGEEFVALMPDIDLRSAHAAAERLRLGLASRPMLVSGASGPIEVTVTVSVGVAALAADDLLFPHLLRRADPAMYAAKAGGRNKVMLDSDPI